MLFKFIVSAVVLLLTFNAASAARQKTSATALKNAGAKALRHMLDRMAPEPDFVKLAASKALRAVDVTAYTTGYLSFATSTSSSCSSTPVMVAGSALNTCIIRSNYAYKVQLTEESCNNAQVEYFLDKECTVSAGTGPAGEADSSCQLITDSSSAVSYYAKLVCTTASTPPAYSDSVMDMTYMEDTTCTSANNGFTSFAQDACLDFDTASVKYTCTSDVPTASYYGDGTCGTLAGSGDIDTTCQTSTIDDDDRYSVGDDDTIVAPPSASTTSFPTLAPAPVPVSDKTYCQAKNAQWNSASSVGSLKGGAIFGIVLGTFATMMSLWA